MVVGVQDTSGLGEQQVGAGGVDADVGEAVGGRDLVVELRPVQVAVQVARQVV